jgi:hypothetical protein
VKNLTGGREKVDWVEEVKRKKTESLKLKVGKLTG